MDEYPNEDEEFELMYEDELELIRTQQGSEGDYGIHNYNLITPNIPTAVSNTKNDEIVNESAAESLIEEPELTLTEEVSKTSTQENGTKKRTIEELFGDIDDILYDERSHNKKKAKNNHDDDFALIEHILELRKLAKERQYPLMATKSVNCNDVYVKDNLSYEVPKYSFETITRFDGKRLYIRCHSEKFLEEEMNKINKKGTFAGCMGETFKDVWKEAQVLLNKQMDVGDNDDQQNMDVSEPSLTCERENGAQLWVDLYKPQRYLELLSDESTNRILLKWFKLWDKIVFNRRPKAKLKKEINKFNSKFDRSEFTMKLDDQGRPEYKIVLLCGSPGLGKTTLAHMVAKHAGYNVVEVNASDDRSTETFKRMLENSTQMSSVIDKDRRPNCIIFDEIDGAPTTTIDFLIKYVNGTASKKRKKDSKEQGSVLKRPIVCICNDLYVPALRSLRQIAFVVNFPPTASVRLAERLQEIARRQNININTGALLALCEKTGNDIRSCLSLMHFFQSLKKPITLSYINRTNVGQKDMQKGLFAVWQDIFQIQYSRKNDQENELSYEATMKKRMQKILQVVHAFGDYERLIQGIFENYLNRQLKDSSLHGICKACEWFCFTDVVNNQIYTSQNYNLATYVQYGFVIWHYLFATATWQRINYPSVGYEVKTKATKQVGLLEEIVKGMKPNVRAFTSANPLKLDVLPLLANIITPAFRPVNIHLYTQKEKDQLNLIVSAMIDYHLNYVQERAPEGHFIYVMDPNVEDIVSFPSVGMRRVLPYSIKQLIAREVELEKMRGIEKSKTDNSRTKKETVPNHLQHLKVNSVKPKVQKMVSKDFFGRIITQSSTSKMEINSKHDLWYQYKEGYNNAVRKRIKVSSLK
ncbi:hypothetical protein RN001_013127 [Aquatica leii]|uniref:AAA+ ATPase domain-containing protein n=1 Tax=Aquatica leii TaxID=1421715 RepID=A0AAN7SC88_9COLE|nr:hypothetical protein RN001_013127 [Aquatica leii]